MTTVETITEHLKRLPDGVQQEVLDFVEFIESRHKRGLAEDRGDEEWSRFSLASAMRGIDGEDSPYTLADLRESSE